MRNLKEIDRSQYPIGTFPEDFHLLCMDCVRMNPLTGEYAFRRAYDNEEKLCYYHMKKRGLLPYQKGKQTMHTPVVV